MKHILVIFLVIMLPFLSSAGKVTISQAGTVARNFYFERAMQMPAVQKDEIQVKNVELVSSAQGQSLYYVVDMNPGGFVLVSATDRIIPVLGYAFEGNFNRYPCNIASWMSYYEDQIRYAIENPITPAVQVAAEWDRLSNGIFSANDRSRSFASVSPLLVSKWNQDTYYNEQCPNDPAGPDGHCYTGCVATAMGQLLYYYRFPHQGQGSYTYYHPVYDTISADFGATTYDWNGMPTSLGFSDPAVATLLFHQGVSVDMDYGPDGSGMWNHKAAYSLKTYFRYGPETQYYFRDSISLDWDSILVSNLNQRKPLYYAGWAGVQSTSGHAFICDGYQDSTYFHFNWGWGGSSDGYFYTDNLTPGGSNFNYAQEVIPLFPDTLQNTYPDYCNGRTVVTGIRGSIEDGSGWYSYQPNSSCSWLIHPQDPDYDSISYIKLTFNRMDTEAGVDKIYVYDGDTVTAPLLGIFSGNTLPSQINSTAGKILVVFETNGNTQLGGWQADYESVIPVYCQANSTITDPDGSLGDGSGDKNYNNNSFCRWKIQPPGAGIVSFTFTDFDLPDSSDVLRVYDLSTTGLLAALTGTQLPDPITSYSGKMMFMFVTNKSTTGAGWDGYYTSSLLGVKEDQSKPGMIRIYPNPAHDHLYINFRSDSDDFLNVELLSPQGKAVLAGKYGVHTGENSFNFETNNLGSSLYFLHLYTANQDFVEKIVIN